MFCRSGRGVLSKEVTATPLRVDLFTFVVKCSAVPNIKPLV